MSHPGRNVACMPGAVVYLRMSNALHDALRDRAEAEGVSMNAFAVQARPRLGVVRRS